MPKDERILAQGTPEEVRAEMKKISRRSFAWGGVAVVAGLVGLAGFEFLSDRAKDAAIAPGFRSAMLTDEAIFRNISGRRIQEHPLNSAVGSRQNGDVGLDGEVDPAEWRLALNPGDPRAQMLTLDEIRGLPRVEMVTEFRCIEGWSQLVHWTGVRFADFAHKYAGESLTKPYVSIETPDGEYYVGLDTESAMHPQTLLCFEMNGAPLEAGHGAPLRLAIPVKYGVKNIKRIGTIKFTDERPKDYWAEQGYDWYCAL